MKFFNYMRFYFTQIKISFLVVIAIYSIFNVAHAQGSAQGFPSKPIRLIVGATTGGAPDLAARLISEKLTVYLGQSVLVENKTGAEHIIASEMVAKSPPDGHTLLLAAINHAVNPSVFKKIPYDTVKDFEPVALAYVVPLVLVVHPSLPVRTVQELVSYAKSNPGKLTFASSGTGSHISMEYFRSLAGLDMVHVPYKGSSASHPDLLSGRINLMFDSITAVDQYVKAGKLRMLGVSTSVRSTFSPTIPTIAESGFPTFDTSSWGGVVAPAGTPKDVIALLNGAILKAVSSPDVRERMLKAGMEPGVWSANQYGDFIKSEITKWEKLSRIAGIKQAD